MPHRLAKSILSAAVVTTLSSAAFAQTTPTFNFGIGIRETNNVAGTTIGSNGGTSGSIQTINAPGVAVPADGQYHLVTFNFGSDPVSNPGLTTGGTTNTAIDAVAGLATLEHLRLVNASGITKPVRVFIDDVISDGILISNFQDVPAAIAPNTLNTMFRAPDLSGTTAQNFARNIAPDSRTTAIQPDGSTDPNLQANRLSFRFVTPEAASLPNGVTGWGRITTLNATTSPNPVIGVGGTSTLTMRIAIVVEEPDYGYVGYDGVSGNNLWSNNDNWGSGTNAGSINSPNSPTATALINEPLVGAPTPRTIALDVPVILQNLQITSPVPYTIAGDTTNTLSLVRSTTGHSPTLTVEAGSHVVNAPTAFVNNVAPEASNTYLPVIWVSPGASVSFTQPVTFNKYLATTTATVPTVSVTKRGGGTIELPDADVTTLTLVGGTVRMTGALTNTITTATLGSAAFPANLVRLDVSPAAGQTKTITTLSVTAGTGSNAARTLGGSLANGTLAATTINVGQNATLKLDFAGQGALVTNSLNLNVTSSVVTAALDLTDDAVLLDYTATSVPTTVRDNIILAFNAGAWNGKGIGSSLLSANTSFGIGYRGLLTGETLLGKAAPDDTTFAVRYVRRGDADLNGTVNFDDLLALAQNYDSSYDPIANGPKLWEDNDNNYDGIVDFNDLLGLAQNYNQSILSGDQLAALGADFAADWAMAQALVPEPTTLAAVGGLAATLLRRRR
jgi:hypothetical protein